jgi:putative ABC transport system permease protein
VSRWNEEIRAAFAPSAIDDDVVEELAQHAALAHERVVADTGDRAEADRRTHALIAQWAADPALISRQRKTRACDEVFVSVPEGASRLAGLAQEFRLGCRALWRQPGFSVLAILTMALSVAATTTLFSLAYGVLVKPMPWADAGRIVRLYETRKDATNRFGAIMTSASYAAWRDDPATIQGLAAWRADRVKMDTGAGLTRVPIAAATASLFPLLGVPPALGSPYSAADEARSAQRPIVLSYGFWQERFGGSPEALGRIVRVDGEPYRVVAVMPRGFLFPDAETRAWVPMSVQFVEGGLSMFSAIARLKPHVTPAQAAAEGTARARGGPDPGMVVMAVFGSCAPAQIVAIPFREALTASVRPAILVFLAAVGLLLATAVANVAGVQLARGTARRREVAIRMALGAGSARLVRQSLVENITLGAAAGVVGLSLVILLHRVLPSILPPAFPRLADVRVDVLVAAFALAVSLAASLASGLLPALQARHVNVVGLLADSGQAPSGVGTRVHSSRARIAIMIGQVAIASVLLCGASLLTRSFLSMLAADRGYDPTNVLTATLALPEGPRGEAPPPEEIATLLERLKAAPGFTHVALANSLPLMPGETLGSFPLRTPYTRTTVQAQAAIRVVSPDYFATLGIRFVAGRPFGPQDTALSKPVVIVNRAFAQKYLGTNAVGTTLWNDTPTVQGPEVIGVIDDVRHRSVTDVPAPELYRVFEQANAGTQLNLAVKTVNASAEYARTLRSLVEQHNPLIDVDAVTPLDALLGTSLAQPRLNAVLAGALALLALIVAAVGLFGVLGYAVAQRTREIGVRTALGARPIDIVCLVLRQGLVMAGCGIVVGLIASFIVARTLATLLFGVTTSDPTTYLIVPAIVLVTSGVACLSPARRAAHVDPLTALRL